MQFNRKDFEWIIIDDGSDFRNYLAYVDIISQVAMESQSRIIRLPANQGLSYARNVGLQIAQGEWIVVLDSDDSLEGQLLDFLRDFTCSKQIVCTSVKFFDQDSVELRFVNQWELLYRKYGKGPCDPLLWFDFYYHGIIARRKLLKFIGGYNDVFRVGEDQDILLRAAEKVRVEDFLFTNKVSYWYRNNPEGVCATQWDNVVQNYYKSMIFAAKRRGLDCEACRFSGSLLLDNAEIDCYQYKVRGDWMTWSDYQVVNGGGICNDAIFRS